MWGQDYAVEMLLSFSTCHLPLSAGPILPKGFNLTQAWGLSGSQPLTPLPQLTLPTPSLWARGKALGVASLRASLGILPALHVGLTVLQSPGSACLSLSP